MRRRRHQIFLSLSPLHGEKAQRNKKPLPFIFGEQEAESSSLAAWGGSSFPIPISHSLPLLSRDFAGKEGGRGRRAVSFSSRLQERESLWTQEHKRRGRLFIGPYLLPSFLLLSIYARFCCEHLLGDFPLQVFMPGTTFYIPHRRIRESSSFFTRLFS